METNPLVPRQRTRRTDRAAQEQPPLPQSPQQLPPQELPQQATPSPVSAQQPTYVQQPMVPQTPRTMYQQPMQQAPRPRALTPAAPSQPRTPQTVRSAAEAPRARTGRSLERESFPRATQAPEAARNARREAPPEEKKVVRKLPGWMTTALSLAVVLVMGLITAYWLMQAYLTTQENERIAAYQAVLDNHHITPSADGTLRVTWQDAIERYAAQYNLQPAFVTAIIRNESSFRTNAESSVGARGLMQLMPDTAEWIARKLDDDSYTFDSMWDAETNIRYGCWYLGYLSRLFHGDAELVSAAYHAGQTTVTQWLSDPARSSDGISLDLDRLTDGPTKQYIGRVTQTYGIYQTLLYPDQPFGSADAVPADGAPAAAGSR